MLTARRLVRSTRSRPASGSGTTRTRRRGSTTGRTGWIASAALARSCNSKGTYAAGARPGSRSTGFSHHSRHPRLLNDHQGSHLATSARWNSERRRSGHLPIDVARAVTSVAIRFALHPSVATSLLVISNAQLSRLVILIPAFTSTSHVHPLPTPIEQGLDEGCALTTSETCTVQKQSKWGLFRVRNIRP